MVYPSLKFVLFYFSLSLEVNLSQISPWYPPVASAATDCGPLPPHLAVGPEYYAALNEPIPGWFEFLRLWCKEF